MEPECRGAGTRQDAVTPFCALWAVADSRLSHRKLSLTDRSVQWKGRVWGKKAGTVVESYCHSEGDRRWGQLWVEAVGLENEK